METRKEELDQQLILLKEKQKEFNAVSKDVLQHIVKHRENIQIQVRALNDRLANLSDLERNIKKDEEDFKVAEIKLAETIKKLEAKLETKPTPTSTTLQDERCPRAYFLSAWWPTYNRKPTNSSPATETLQMEEKLLQVKP